MLPCLGSSLSKSSVHFLLRDDVLMEITHRCSERRKNQLCTWCRGTRGQLVSGLCMSDTFIEQWIRACVCERETCFFFTPVLYDKINPVKMPYNLSYCGKVWKVRFVRYRQHFKWTSTINRMWKKKRVVIMSKTSMYCTDANQLAPARSVTLYLVVLSFTKLRDAYCHVNSYRTTIQYLQGRLSGPRCLGWL